MVGLGFQRLLRSSQSKLFISSFFVLFTHLALSMVPRLFASLSLLSMLPISGLALLGTLVFGRFFRRVVGVSASAPAFVLFNLIFVWGVYVSVIRKVMTCTMDVIFYVECVLLLIGLDSVLSSDPGMVSCTSSHSGNMDQSAVSEKVLSIKRVRICNICNANVLGFDHHCPAFGNCIGQKNHLLFIILLIGFLVTEATYIICSTYFIKRSMWPETGMKFMSYPFPASNLSSGIMDWHVFVGTRIIANMLWLGTAKARFAGYTCLPSDYSLLGTLSGSLAVSTMLFSLLQVLWQINWKKYPEFQIIHEPQIGEYFPEVRFWNPYDKGIVGNIKEFLKPI
ncbi:hypothetical protein QJS10_CPB20g00934 [Acorus calamus]|uniref:S-acyltransferase n=1 Tax=Acorus calamus TaxID=4465 RepID=A0AAV9CCL1_ACOCL|nr:hypothetical protein QJS10_CPB20g00934 [Acorus calamus]